MLNKFMSHQEFAEVFSKISCDKLADAIGVSGKTIYRWRAGKENIEGTAAIALHVLKEQLDTPMTITMREWLEK